MATETDITGQLADYFGWLERELGTEGLAVQRTRPRARVPHRAPALVAAGLLVIGAVVGAIALVREPSKSVRPAAGVSTWSEIAGAAWTLDSPPAGMQFQSAQTSSDPSLQHGTSGYVLRLYASASATPETDPYVRLAGYPVGTVLEHTPPDATQVDVGGVTGSQWSRGEHAHVMFERDGLAFHLDTVGIPDPVALAATATAAPDGYGAVIDPALLPTGVAERAAGTVFEMRFLSRQALTGGPTGEAHWGTPDASSGIFYFSFVESPEVFRLHRIEYDYASLGEVEVNGHAALRTTSTDGPMIATEHTELYWNDNGRTIVVGGYGGVTREQVIAAARALRPATEAEWAAMTDAEPTPVTVTASTVEAAGQAPLGFQTAPSGYVLVGEGVVPAGGEDVAAAVFVTRDADGTVSERVIARAGDVGLSGDPSATSAMVDLAGHTVHVDRDLGADGNLTLDAYFADQADLDGLVTAMQEIASALVVGSGHAIAVKDPGSLPAGWELAVTGVEPEQSVSNTYQAFEVAGGNGGGDKLRVDNRFIGSLDGSPYWLMGRTLAPVTVRGHAGFVSAVPYGESRWATVLIWEEAPGHWVTLMAQGWTTEQALALADQLVPTS